MSTHVFTTQRPLVAAVGARCYVWIEHGIGFLLDERDSAAWHPLTDAPGLGGRVLASDEVAALVATHGRPVTP